MARRAVMLTTFLRTLSQTFDVKAAGFASAASTAAYSTTMATPIRIRKSADRGHANHGWLDSYHTFSFASYHDPKFEGFGPLRVINEDKVQGDEGFPTHPHSNYEIFSYVINGALKHHDSMGNKEVIKRGEVQFTSAGTGIQHAEFNASPTDLVHFLQIWVKPNKMGLKPNYQTKAFPDANKLNALCPIITQDGSNETITINQDFRMFAGILEDGKTVTHSLAGLDGQQGTSRKGYLHLPILAKTQGLTLAGTRLDGSEAAAVRLEKGDGAFLEGLKDVTITGHGSAAEFVLMDFGW